MEAETSARAPGAPSLASIHRRAPAPNPSLTRPFSFYSHPLGSRARGAVGPVAPAAPAAPVGSPVGRHAPPAGARAARPPRRGGLNGPSCGGGGSGGGGGGGGGASLPSPRRAGARWSTRVRGWDGGAGRGPGTLRLGGARSQRLHNSSLPRLARWAHQRAGRRAAPGSAGTGAPPPRWSLMALELRRSAGRSGINSSSGSIMSQAAEALPASQAAVRGGPAGAQ